MFLTKEQSFNLILKGLKAERFNNKYRFTTKTKTKCLYCGATIYVSYYQFNRKAIFCHTKISNCFTMNYRKPTWTQYQYMRKIKEDQLQFIEKTLEK